MSSDNTVEYNSLSWVKVQLEHVIVDAQTCLSEYIESKADNNPNNGELESCIEHLKLIYGTLQMVEVYGASMLVEEMQHTAVALLEAKVERVEDAYDVLMRAMLQLPDYLEGVAAGKQDTPIALLPLINDLRAAYKESLLTESALFSPDLGNVTLSANGDELSSISTEKLQVEIKRLRAHYQLGLLDYIKNNKQSAGLQRIRATLKALEKVSGNDEVRRIWMVIGALVEGLMTQGIDSNLSVKMLLADVDRQLKHILDKGEDDFSRHYSKELVKNALYYVGLCTVDSKLISAVKEAYQLSELIPRQSDGYTAISGLNAELFDTVSKGITEDLMKVKDILELSMQGDEPSVEKLAPAAEQLGKIADTYGMLGLGSARQSLIEQRAVLESMVNGDVEVNDSTVLDIATELLNAEAELKDYIDARSGFVDMNPDKQSRSMPASEYRQVVRTVVAEGLRNFSDAKEAILCYIAGTVDQEELHLVLNRLEEVRGVSMMLPLDRVAHQIADLQNYIRIALLDNSHQVDADEQDTVADLVTSIEYFFEALAEGRPSVEQGLDVGDEAAAKLKEVTASYGQAEQESLTGIAGESADVSHQSMVTEEEQEQEKQEEIQLVEIEIAELESIPLEQESYASMAETAVKASPVALKGVTDYIILDDDADEEIIEIFIEEAVEILGELHENLAKWRVNDNDEEAPAVMRRGFHTLKGSGRLLGAEMIAEFSWKIENMINHFMDKNITASEPFFHVLDEALAVLPQLIEQLQGNREPIDNLAQLMLSADILAEGRNISTETVGSDDIAEEKNIFLVDEIDDVTIVVDTIASDPSEIDDFDDEIEASLRQTEDDTTFLEKISIVETPADEKNSVAEGMFSAESGRIEALIKEAAGDVESADDLFIAEEQGIESAQVAGINLLDEETVSVAEGSFDIDPVLLKIYYDESQGYVETIRQLIHDSEISDQPLKADKKLLRVFHTLYGSARTAEVPPIAELSGAIEKYVKLRQEGETDTIPHDVVTVLKAAEQAITGMLATVEQGKIPVSNEALQDKINKIVEQEVQAHLQYSFAGNPLTGSDDAGMTAIDVRVSTVVDELKKGAESEANADIIYLSPDDFSDETGDVFESELEGNSKVGIDSSNGIIENQNVEVHYSDIDDELIDIFLEEAETLLENSELTLNEIKNTPRAMHHIQQLQRNMHTLKGGARMADLIPVGDLTHNLESLVVMVNDEKIKTDKTLFDLLQESLDVLTGMLVKVKKRQSLPSVTELNSRIETLMAGGVKEKCGDEQIKTDLSELEADAKVIAAADLSLLPSSASNDDETNTLLAADEAEQKETEDEDRVQTLKNRPHWGQRASDVTFNESHEQIRVRADLLNNLIDYAGEVNIYHARMGKQIVDFGFNLAELTQTVVRLKEQLRKFEIETEIQIRSGYEKQLADYDDGFDPLEMDQYSTLQQLSRSLSETAADVDSINGILTDITRDSETLLRQESRVSTDLQEGLIRTRMVRFGGLTSRLRRIVRQTARELDKEVAVEIIGEDTEVDRTVLDRIIAPIEHILRNAVAHGIEESAVRKTLGKDETGRIIVNVDRQGVDIVIKITDDGAGIDAAKVREQAIKQNLITADTPLTDRDALQFILQSGFTTVDKVTQVSGRGVGLDVVDSGIKQLGGVLDIDTVRGKGVEFTIRLPLTLAINQALLVRTGEDVFAVPLASIEGVVRITGYELQGFYDSHNSRYEFNDTEFELKHLGGLLTGYQADYSKQMQLFPVLLVRMGDQHFALHVDEMLGRREIVVKPVGRQLSAVRGVAGATILADGRVVLILELSALLTTSSLLKSPARLATVEQDAVDTRKTILVVDDSITIRKITERMLKRYGIDVVLAKDGIDATGRLQERIPDLILLDIEMPRMDGFALASFVRSDSRLKDLPIIMITSRTGAKHKEKAMKIGVNKYLGKPFHEDDLLDNINQLLHTTY